MCLVHVIKIEREFYRQHPFIKMDFIANTIHKITHSKFNCKYVKPITTCMTNLLTVRKASSENVSPVLLLTRHR